MQLLVWLCGTVLNCLCIGKGMVQSGGGRRNEFSQVWDPAKSNNAAVLDWSKGEAFSVACPRMTLVKDWLQLHRLNTMLKSGRGGKEQEKTLLWKRSPVHTNIEYVLHGDVLFPWKKKFMYVSHKSFWWSLDMSILILGKTTITPLKLGATEQRRTRTTMYMLTV